MKRLNIPVFFFLSRGASNFCTIKSFFLYFSFSIDSRLSRNILDSYLFLAELINRALLCEVFIKEFEHEGSNVG